MRERELRCLGGLVRVIDGGNDSERKGYKGERERAGCAVNNISCCIERKKTEHYLCTVDSDRRTLS